MVDMYTAEKSIHPLLTSLFAVVKEFFSSKRGELRHTPFNFSQFSYTSLWG
jgi:hypothetical protein